MTLYLNIEHLIMGYVEHEMIMTNSENQLRAILHFFFNFDEFKDTILHFFDSLVFCETHATNV